MTVSIVIPTYNGKHILRQLLSTLDGYEQVIVVDDAGSDGTAEMVRESFPKVTLIVKENNEGFSSAVNQGIRASTGEFVILLNNDVEIGGDFLDAMLPLFSDDKVFSVSPRILLPSQNNLDEGCKTGIWNHGLFYTSQRQSVSGVTNVLYTTACAAVYRRSMLDALGGFDEAYSPFYWEDTDLGYRAWKRGWKSLYQPECAVIHRHAATTSLMKKSYTDRIKARNSLFFIWRNIEDSEVLARHRRWLPLVLSKRIAQCDWAFLNGWRDAYQRRHEALSARTHDSQFRVLSDREIFAECGVDLR